MAHSNPQHQQMDVQMEEIREDRKFRTTPENGHCLLLMEAEKDQRTFSDYPDLLTCTVSIQELYEQHRLALGQDREQYTLEHLWKWIDGSFRRMEVFIYDRELARYKKYTRAELKVIFVQQIQKAANAVSASSQSKQQQQSHSKAAIGHRSSTGSTPDSEEDWDI